MSEEFVRLLEAAKALVTYIDEEHVFDKAADAGCGGVDTYRSEKFDELIEGVKKVLEEVENEI
jgi:hypothetical protein